MVVESCGAAGARGIPVDARYCASADGAVLFRLARPRWSRRAEGDRVPCGTASERRERAGDARHRRGNHEGLLRQGEGSAVPTARREDRNLGPRPRAALAGQPKRTAPSALAQ